MSPRVVHRWILWLLPLLLARLCVPVGFMVSATSDGLDVMLCPAYAALPASAAANGVHAHHAGMDHSAHAMHGSPMEHGSHQDSTREGLSQSLCPFAATGATPLAASVSTVDGFHSLPGLLSLLPDQPVRIAPAGFIDRIRGPPFA